VQIPNEFKELISRRQGCKCNHNPETAEKFLNWLQHSFNPGIHGKPHDRVLVEQDDCGKHCYYDLPTFSIGLVIHVSPLPRRDFPAPGRPKVWVRRNIKMLKKPE